MKNILSLLLILLFSITSYSQITFIAPESNTSLEIKTENKDSIQVRLELNELMRKYNLMDAKLKTAGKELKLYSNHYYLGFGLIVGGNLVLVAASSSSQINPPVVGIGISLNIVGAILMFQAPGHVGKAGRLLSLNENKLKPIDFGFNNGGLGFAYQF